MFQVDDRLRRRYLSFMPEIIPREHFDLALRLRTDDKLIGGMQSMTSRLADLSKSSLSLDQYRKKEGEIMHSIWKDCGLNISALMPFFFPKYPKREPMSMFDRPFNMILLFLLPYHG